MLEREAFGNATVVAPAAALLTASLPGSLYIYQGDELGLDEAKTYIASGNLLFSSGQGEDALKAALAKSLTAHMGKPVEVMIRTAPVSLGIAPGKEKNHDLLTSQSSWFLVSTIK